MHLNLKKITFLLVFIFLWRNNYLFSYEDNFVQLRSEHFIVYYRQDVSQQHVSSIVDMLENFYRLITGEFNLVRDKLWLWENRTKVYIAKDKKDYLENFKCPFWSGACVDYKDRIIYTYPDQKNSSLIFAHELTHIIFREYIKDSPLPCWFEEGMATYIEHKSTLANQHFDLSSLKKMIQNKKHIKFDELMNISCQELYNLSESKINIFYLQSFSIINFLIKNYGKDNFTQLLFYLRSGLNFGEAFSKSFLSFRTLEELENKWKKYYTEN
ncbi:MAG: peptidase MA family metallohydrolase [Candidatus Omnitrophica bacterium]|nr:peptidase MA family metallohydrolase [Candidatus Omnitrophota bacterium]